ncbi:MAG: glycogen synthase [Firmicutes bacterium]|nr:glycogen synthase [Bacillota bacterium]
MKKHEIERGQCEQDGAAKRNGYEVTIMTNEYPPNVYGGAGVHVEYLTKFLSELIRVEVRCFGEQRFEGGSLRVRGYLPWEVLKATGDPRLMKAISPFSVNLAMVADPLDSKVVHCHTWYTFMAGFMAKMLYNVPLVTTIHSLEPLRPWKENQLGRAYRLSSWMEEMGIRASDRIIAVSNGMREDILRCYPVDAARVVVIYNGIDTVEYRRTPDDEALKEYGIQGRYILFVGRITQQKGILHLVDAASFFPEGVKLVLCASAPDTEEDLRRLRDRISGKNNIIWIDQMVEKKKLIQLYSHAAVFACPSVYEPFGIINLEAMSCETPVVASAVGGIKEVVVDGETGLLVEPGNPVAIADAVKRVLGDEDLRGRLGRNGRRRVEAYFGWDVIARKTKALYDEILETPNPDPPSRP